MARQLLRSTLTYTFLVAAVVFSLTLDGKSVAQPTSADGPLRIAVYGASGRTGSAIVSEALDRGHYVLGIGRDPSSITLQHDRLSTVSGDILDVASVVRLIDGYDVVAHAARGPVDADNLEASVTVAGARALVSAIRELGDNGPRMTMVGGGRTLQPGDGYEDWNESPLESVHHAALDFLQSVTDVEWTVLVPPSGGMLSAERVRTGRYRVGGDVVLRDPDGEFATISLDDFAAAMLDEIEAPQNTFRRFTVAW